VKSLRILWTFIWGFLLIHMATFVVSSMVGVSYDPVVASILGVITPLLIIFIAMAIPNEPASEHH
jgi:hypothetical protein